MAVIKINFGEGGANLNPRGTGTPTLVTALRDIADDFAGFQVADIASPDATDLATAITLVNEIKGALNAVAPSGYTIKTVKG